MPNLITEFDNLDFSFFIDAVNLWHVDYDSSLESNKIRSSTGLSANWFTPIGPLSLSYALPLSDAPGDKTETFRFQIGTFLMKNIIIYIFLLLTYSSIAIADQKIVYIDIDYIITNSMLESKLITSC